jgi:tetratricopeptide (TPR) repeat protein
LKGISPEVREVLHTLVGFRMPASYATLEALLMGPDKACQSAQELDRALTELEDRGLIGWDREANRYDAHPIVRGVVWQLANAKDQRAVYTALEAHFEPMGTPEWNKVETLADLTPAIERYHTLVGLRRYDDAFALFRDRLNDATLYRLAAHRERIEWLERLFPDGVDRLPAVTSGDAEASVLNALAASYRSSGQPGRSAPLYRRASEIRKSQGDAGNRQVILSNLSNAFRDTGALREAVGALRRALVLNRELDDKFWEGVSLQNLGSVLCAMGAHVAGLAALARSRRLFTEQGARQSQGVVAAYIAQRSLWLGDFVQAAVWAEQAWELAAHHRVERDFIGAALMQGEAALGVPDPSRADERLHHALLRARAVNVVEFELPALIAIAKLDLQRGHPAEAKARLDDVWEAAGRGPYPRQQADAHNVLAAIALAEGDKPAASAAAAKAYKAAWCDGPPYAYHWGLEQAKAHLAVLGAPEPAMPPFDESKFEPVPEVEINPKDDDWVDPDSLD